MEENKEGQTTTKLIKEFFGIKEGEVLKDFVVEFKKLTPEDKEQLAEGIRNGSLTY